MSSFHSDRTSISHLARDTRGRAARRRWLSWVLAGLIVMTGALEWTQVAWTQSGSVTLTATSDNYIKQGSPNSNQGTETVVRIQQSGKNRVLVQFDEQALEQAVGSSGLRSAKLRLYIVSNSNNWGADGREVDVHRLTQAWSEMGSTWNCPNDSNTSNSNAECGPSWDMGGVSLPPFVSAPTQVVLHQNNQTGWVEWDVTADARKFLSHEVSNYGWIVRKDDEGQAGQVDYSSREGAFPPQLVVTPGEPEPPTGPNLSAVGDTDVRSGAANQNQGNQMRLQASGNARVLVQFDRQAMIQTVGGGVLLNAKLRLYILSNNNSWGTSGRAVNLHRMRQAWTEPGATWNCPEDTNPFNSQANCSPSWNLSTSSQWPFAVTPTSSVTQQNNQTGWVEWDVSADVGQILNNTLPNYGWMIRKDNEGQSGQVEYGSRESGFKPQLIFTVTSNNQAPQVSAGPNQIITPPNTANLNGTVIDDGLPAGGVLTIAWSKISGPGTVTFASPNSASTTATFSAAGDYVLRLTASDSLLSSNAQVTVHVNPFPLPSISTSVSPAPNGNSWNNTNVTVSFNCIAGGLPIVSCSPSQTVSSDGSHVIEGSVVDQAGNSASTQVTVNVDKSRPFLSPRVTPPSVAGWNRSDVRVSFDCADAVSGIGACPELALVSNETASQTFSGTVNDRAGNTATSNVTVRLDKTPPSLNITSPAEGSTLSADTVMVTGSSSDLLSGVIAVTCNGLTASLSGAAFNCNVPLTTGSNELEVTAQDLAGNRNSGKVYVTTTGGTPPAPATSLQITPGKVTLLVGENHDLKLVDNLGRELLDAIWSISDSALGELSANNPPTVTGKAVGQVTVTANWQGLSAQAEVTILGGTSLPPGTVRWSLPVSGQIILAQPTGGDTPDLYSLEGGGFGGRTVRALTSEGQQKWVASITDPTFQIFGVGDNQGGVVLRHTATDNRVSLIRLDPATKRESWRYPASNVASLGENWAVHPDGTIYIVDGESLLGIDVQTGATKLAVPLPRSTSLVSVGEEACCTFLARGGIASAPMVSAEGSVYLEVATDSVTETSYSNQLSLLRVEPSGSFTLTPLVGYTGSNITAVQSIEVAEVIPDGQGGVLAAWTRGTGKYSVGTPVYEAMVTRVTDTGQNQYSLPLGSWPNGAFIPVGTMVLGEGGVAFAQANDTSLPYQLLAFDVATGSVPWTWQSPTGWNQSVQLVASSAGGGLVVQDGSAVVRLDANGQPVMGESFNLESATYWTLGQWHGFAGGQLASVSGFLFNLALNPFPVSQGNFQKQGTGPTPVVASFAPLENYAKDGSSYPVTQFRDNVLGLALSKSYQHKFYLANLTDLSGNKATRPATVKNFLKAVGSPLDAVGFIGHGYEAVRESDNRPFTIGMNFYNGEPLVRFFVPNDPILGIAPREANATILDLIKTQAKVIFIAACALGEPFKQMWDITDSTTNRALIVNVQNSVEVDLKQGLDAWIVILDDLRLGHTVGQAVDRLNNDYMAPLGRPERWMVVGGQNVRIRH